MERTLHIVVDCGDAACERCPRREFYGPPTAVAPGEVVRCGLFRSDSAAGIVSKMLVRSEGAVLRCLDCLAAEERGGR